MSSKAAAVAELFTKAVATTKSFDQNLRKLKVISCSNGRMVTEFQVGPEHLNQRGTLHGGFIALLVDSISTYALTANEHIDTRGVSIDLSVTYMSAAKEGDNIEIEAITKKTGKKIAFLEVEVRNKDRNQLLATGRHTNYMSAAKEGDNIEIEAITKKTGKKIAFLEVEVRNKDRNQLLATGRHTNYMSAAKEGDNIEIEAITKKTGKKIAFLEVEVRNKDRNQLLATGRHTKYIAV